MNSTELQIIVSSGVIGGLLVMGVGAALPMLPIPDELPPIAQKVLSLVQAHADHPVASFILVAAIVSAALYARSKVEPVFKVARATLGDAL